MAPFVATVKLLFRPLSFTHCILFSGRWFPLSADSSLIQQTHYAFISRVLLHETNSTLRWSFEMTFLQRKWATPPSDRFFVLPRIRRVTKEPPIAVFCSRTIHITCPHHITASRSQSSRRTKEKNVVWKSKRKGRFLTSLQACYG